MGDNLKNMGSIPRKSVSKTRLTRKQWSKLFAAGKLEYMRFVSENKRKPDESSEDIIIQRVYDCSSLEGLKLSWKETSEHIRGFIHRQNINFVLEGGAEGSRLQKMPEMKPISNSFITHLSYSELPGDAKMILDKRMALAIGQHINNTGRVPSTAHRNSQLGGMVNDLNRHKYKRIGLSVIADENIYEVYDDICKKLYADFCEDGKILLETKKERLLNEYKIFETERTIISQIYFSDSKIVGELIVKSENTDILKWDPAVRHEVKKWITQQQSMYDRNEMGYYLIVEKSTRESVGLIKLTWDMTNEEKILKISCIIKKEHRLKGFADECVKEALRYAFVMLNADAVIAVVRADNDPAQCLAKKIGMELTDTYMLSVNKTEHYKYVINRARFAPE